MTKGAATAYSSGAVRSSMRRRSRSQKGGTGKSTLTRALAAIVAHAGLNVRIADLGPQQNTVIEWEKLRKDNNLAPIRVEAYDELVEAIESGEEGELLILDTPAHGPLDTDPRSGRRPRCATIERQRELLARRVPKERLGLALCRTSSEREEGVARPYLKAAGYEVLPGSNPEKFGESARCLQLTQRQFRSTLCTPALFSGVLPTASITPQGRPSYRHLSVCGLCPSCAVRFRVSRDGSTAVCKIVASNAPGARSS